MRTHALGQSLDCVAGDYAAAHPKPHSVHAGLVVAMETALLAAAFVVAYFAVTAYVVLSSLAS